MSSNISRRSFLAFSAALPAMLRGIAWGTAKKNYPVGLELYSVRDALQRDPQGTVRAVAKMGYQAVEFYAPYYEWTDAQATEMRKLMDDLGVRCYSTHNDESYFTPEKIDHARDLNKILGATYMVQAWSDPKSGLDGWKELAMKLNAAADKLAASGLKVGYHNHDAEWKLLEGKRPMDVLAAKTNPTIMLQLDVGTCVEAGADPVAWIRSNPGRIHSIHCKDWSPDDGYKVLFGQGKADWKGIFNAAESVGGIEYYLIEQEGSDYPQMETARRCLTAFRNAYRDR